MNFTLPNPTYVGVLTAVLPRRLGVVQGRIGYTQGAPRLGIVCSVCRDGLIHAGIRGDFRCVEEFIGRARELARG
jgi:hypothetical protein